MVWIYGQPDQDGFEHQGFIVQSEAGSDPGIVIFTEYRFFLPSEHTGVDKCEKRNIEPVKITLLEINGFQAQIKPFFAINVIAGESSDQIVFIE